MFGTLYGNLASSAGVIHNGLVAWYDATTTSLGAVASWPDKSGSGNNATQATGGQQPVNTSSILNGKNVLLFTAASSQTLLLPSALYAIPNAANTIFAVAKRNTETAAQNEIICFSQTGVTRTNQIVYSATSGNIMYRNNGAGTDLTLTGAVNTNYQIIYGRHSGATQAISINNGIEVTNSSGANVATTDIAAIGSSQGTTLYLNGGIAEILIYNRSLSVAEINQVESYLSAKWGVAVTLPNEFVSQWKTDNAGTSSSTQITIPTVSSGTYACTVSWGDGTTSNITTYNDAAWTHTYSVAGTYTVIISGTFNGIQFNNGGDKLKLLNISQWGTGFTLGNTDSYFFGCANLTITATDVLSMVGTTTLNKVFSGCAAITTIPSLNSWDFTAITTMASMLQNCPLFNQAINFTTSSSLTTTASMINNCGAFNSSVTISNMLGVTTMSGMFSVSATFNQPLSFTTSNALTNLSNLFNGCTAFNSAIAISNMTKVTTMVSMFQSCTNYNQPINFTTSSSLTTTFQMMVSCTHFNSSFAISDVTGVTTMGAMFQSCTIFNQPLSFTTSNSLLTLSSMMKSCSAFNSSFVISNTSHVTTMASMFQSCTAFNQDVSGFNIAALTDATTMFTSSGFTITNYNKLLDSVTGWPSQATIKNNVVFSAGNAHYSGVNAIAGRLVLTGTHAWTVTDGGTP